MYEYLEKKSISFEGGEGSGKGTILRLLKQELDKNSNLHILLTREPGGSNISEQIRNVILDKKNTEICNKTEALLFCAARAQLMNDIIFPSLENNETILLDRFIDSSLVYQGYSENQGIETIYDLNLFATNGWLPDLTFVLDIEPEIGFKRIENNNRNTNRLDEVSLNFHKKVREGYLTIAKLYPDRIKVINANQTKEKILEDVLIIIEKELKN